MTAVYKNLVILLVGFIFGGALGMVAGVKMTIKNDEKKVIEKETVVERLQEQAFLVTTSVLSSEKTEINIDQGSSWSNFWWGHKVTASGNMQVAVGVDLSKIKDSDIVVDNTAKTITVTLPDAEINSIEIIGDIEVSTESGIFKKLFDSDTNADYNLALAELKDQSKTSIEGKNEVMKSAKESTISILNSIFKDSGYKVVGK